MAGAKNHDYHILPPSIWPLVGSFGALIMFGGLVMWMHAAAYGSLVFGIGLLAVLFTFYSCTDGFVRSAEEAQGFSAFV